MKFLRNLFKGKPKEREEPSAQMTIVWLHLRAPEPVSFNPKLSDLGHVLDAGDLVCCVNGHPVCRAQRNLDWGMMDWSSVFGSWVQPEPAVGNEVKPCTICGEPWLDKTYGIYVKTHDHGIQYRGNQK